ncbi:osmotically inducible protein OsmC [Elizabethkingia meningoseptica]|uniref:OsmC family protein n=1 Tax=Elizabethkingia meningoseptica TaxID=238 RepID=UPI000332CB70|nr:OsmC family protein [Elizabethkingia meningoseptica]AQX04222.1 osmotically inducible protein OsmC [Elizabethkingia meningoseptica]AQX46264.1 osmotically inducible protein OsmC [Elizabethkingia meningoseptica]EOR30780.1 OsmC family protein [Elizabethkingia meningoseptica ATCC 13253 = NBRC 12535]KUY18780.1 osmotically inducible protein OsmC [Elizabethkingia meningoseptica]OPB73248.1 osmotically inducible protein OsmC [Elizabethkingia meningoseptica]
MTSKITYTGNLRCESEHLQSGNSIITDAPTDNHGQGAAFSPTDLCATSLGQCMLTTIAILGKSKNINIEGATCDITKIMNPAPRKIAEIVCDLKFPSDYSDEEKQFIEHTALNCPVALSLHPDIKKTVSFTYK